MTRPCTPSPTLTFARLFALSALLCIAARPLQGQVTAPVPLESRTYDRVDDLLAAGVGGNVVVGQRPYSRLMVGQVVYEARLALARRNDLPPAAAARLERIVAALEVEYAAEVARFSTGVGASSGVRNDGAMLETVALDSPPRGISDVGLGSIDATINPLAQGRGGRRFGRRVTGAMEGAVSRGLGPHVAAAAHVRLSTARPEGEVRAVNATIGARNVVVQVGRVPLQYGQGLAGGMFASRNAPGLDMVRVGTDRPARLPWVLGRLGPAMGSLFVADLGASQHFPHAKMAGWKMSFLPSSRFEIGASLLSIQGGDGAPAASAGERIVDVLTIIDVLFYQDRDLLFSNKLAGMDFRVRFPRAEVYFDGMVDDFDARRIASSLWEDAGYTAGVVVSRLGADGGFRLDAEYQHTGLRYYQHGQFKSGVTARGEMIGLPLGPRGDAVTARLRRDAARGRVLQVTGALEQRSDDRYTISTDGPDDSGWRFVKSEDRPEEVRARVLVGAAWDAVYAGARLEAEAGYERVLRDGFVEGAARNNLLARIAFVTGFD